MKRRILSILSPVLLFLVVLTACGGRRNSNTMVADSPFKINGSWYVDKLLEYTIQRQTERQMTVTFNLPEGRIYGFGMCNNFGSAFMIAQSGKIAIEDFMSTRVGCEGNNLETMLMEALTRSTHVMIEEDKAYFYATKGDKLPLVILTR